MTPQEFKAWFEGFTEAMSGPPTQAQWDRIQEKVKQMGAARLAGLGMPGILPNTVSPSLPNTTPYYTLTNARDAHERFDMAAT